MNLKILVVDDENDVQALVRSNLMAAGFQIITAEDGPSGLEKARRELPSLVILDLMLPGMSGLDVCKALKSDERTTEIPVIMLTAKAEEIDRIVGLELGAEDYITKPFSPRELVLRVKGLIKRVANKDEKRDMLKVGDIVLDRARYQASVKSKQLDLTATEFKLLSVLMEKRGRVYSRDNLLNEVWGYESIIDTRTVDTHMRRLREKLGKAANHIQTVRGFGYRIVDEN